MVAITPFASSPTVYNQFRLVKEITVQILIVLILTAWVIGKLWQPAGLSIPWKNWLRAPRLFPFGLLITWCLFSILFSPLSAIGWYPFINLLLYFALYLILAEAGNQRFLRVILWIALAAGSINATYAIAQYYGHDPIFHMDLSGASKVAGRLGAAGFLDNPNLAGAYLSLTFVAALGLLFQESSGKKQALIAVGLALILLGILYTQTLAALAGLFAGLATWALYVGRYEKSARKYLMTFGVLVLLGITMVVVVNRNFRARLQNAAGAIKTSDWDTALSRRPTIWRATVGMIKDRPLVGHGLGTYAALFFDYHSQAIKGRRVAPLADLAAEAHNEYLQIWTELGLLGLMLFLASVGVYVGVHMRTLAGNNRPPPRLGSSAAERKSTKKYLAPTKVAVRDFRICAMISLTALMTVLVNSLANFPFHQAAMMSLLVVILALSLSSPRPEIAASLARSPRGPEELLLKWGASLAALVTCFWAVQYLCCPYTSSKLELWSYLTLHRIQEKGLSPDEDLTSTLRRVDAWLERAKSLVPTNQDLYMMRGATYRWEGLYQNALKEYEMAAGYRRTPEVFIATGSLYLEMKDPDRARSAYQKSIDFNPASLVAQDGLARAERLKTSMAHPLPRNAAVSP